MYYYKETGSAVLTSVETTEKGLSSQSARTRLDKFGPNELDTKTSINLVSLFISQFKSFIIYILLFAVVFSLLVHEYVDAVIIMIILVVNALIGFFQELSAQKSLESLKQLNTVTAKVFRDGQLLEVDSKELVPGDVIFVGAGDKVPADVRLLEVTRLKVQEASLTGESLSVSKQVEPIKKDVQLGDQKNMLFSSTIVSEGSAKGVVVETGMSTEIGKITSLIKEAEEEQTPLQRKLDDFGQKLGYVIIVICVLILLVSGTKEYLANGFSPEVFLHVILIAISLAVAAVPEGLPAVVTIALSVGVKRLLKRKALVRRLASVETLGSCDVICTDKTGTLTKNEMTVQKAWIYGKEANFEGVGYNPKGLVSDTLDPLLYTIGSVCNHSTHYKKDNLWTISGDPTEAALLVSAKKNGVEGEVKIHDELPFESDRKMMSVLVGDKKRQMYTKGAPDELLERCSYLLKDGKKIKLTDEHRKTILSKTHEYSTSALRVLGFAYKDISSDKDFKEKDLVFVGLQAMIDPPREDVIDAIARTKEAGIRVVVITGDHADTAKAIAAKIGITGKVLTGADLEKMDEAQLREALEDDTNIFARVIPEHKQRIVSLLQHMGHVVAMTGDGVNDAPALKKADIGVAVGSGTDVAKEASDFVLLDDSFANIVNAIEEGRGIYDNIQKVIVHLLSGNLAEVLIIFLAVLLNFNLPLTAVLLLWINLVTDGAPALALSVDPYNKNIMKRKPVDSREGILPKSWWILISYLGLISTIIGLYLFSIFGGNSGDPYLLMQAQTMVFTYIVLAEIILLLIIRSLYNISIFTNSWIWLTIVMSILLQVVIIYTPLNELFEIVPLGFVHMVSLLFGGFLFFLSYLIYTNFIKKTRYGVRV